MKAKRGVVVASLAPGLHSSGAAAFAGQIHIVCTTMLLQSQGRAWPAHVIDVISAHGPFPVLPFSLSISYSYAPEGPRLMVVPRAVLMARPY